MAALSHRLGPGGELAPEWGPGCPVVGQVPGSGEEAWLLRSWDSVMAALRDPSIRDLRKVTTAHAMAGVTLQHEKGLLRRSDTSVRALLNPVWRQAACERYRPALAHLARWRAVQSRATTGKTDLIASFIGPYVRDVIMLATGFGDEGQAAELSRLSDLTTGALLRSPADHAPASRAWDDLYALTAEAIGQARRISLLPLSQVTCALDAAGMPRTNRSLLSRTIAVLEDAGMGRDEVNDVVATVCNGLPTTLPALVRVTEQLFAHPHALEACRENPDLVPAAVREVLRRAAHFTFALPGVTRRAVTLDGQDIPAGAAVLPLVHAAEYDTARTADPEAFRLDRGQRAILAWGAGGHACLGRHYALIALEEAVEAIARMRLRLMPGDLAWREGTMPVPAELLVDRQRAGLEYRAVS